MSPLLPPSPKTITIMGSTGIQGASVLHHLLRSPPTHFHLKAITTRPGPTPSLPPTSAHPNLTTHVLPAPTSRRALADIFTGSHAVYANTHTLSPQYQSTGPGSPKATEIEALHAAVDAAIDAKVGLLILSCLPDCGAELQADSPDFVNKVAGMRYAKKRAAETGLRVVYVQLGWYFSNFIEDHDPVVCAEDGVVEFFMRGLRKDRRVPWISTYTDLGPIVKALIDNPEPYIGKEIPIVAELLTMEEIAAIYQNVTGHPSRALSPPLPSESESVSPQGDTASWACLMAILNAEAYLVDETGMQLAMELMRKERPDVGMTGWAKWLGDTGFDVWKKGEGYGEGVRGRRERWGGRKFL